MNLPTEARPSDRVIIPSHVHARRFEDELVILDLMRGEYFSLNAVGARIWERLSAGDTLEETANLLFAEYDVDLESLREDGVRLVKELLSRGLVRLVQAAP